jgi:predicted nucleic acid-binding protein
VKQFVVDNSVVMAWAFEDEHDDYADKVLDSFNEATALAPPLWPLEAANVLAVAERKGRLPKADSLRFLALLNGLPIELAPDMYDGITVARNTLTIARDFGISAYDAAYLGLAIDHDLPLATQDTGLRNAARQASVPIWCA